MKKHLITLCVSVAFVALGTADVYARNAATAGKTTSENRSGNQLTLSSNQDQVGILGSNSMVALNQMISQAPNQPAVAAELLSQSKKDDTVMKALLGKLENDIQARDALLMTLLSDPEFVNIVMQTYAKDYPKTAATLSANTAAAAPVATN